MAGNLNSGRSYLITAVVMIVFDQREVLSSSSSSSEDVHSCLELGKLQSYISQVLQTLTRYNFYSTWGIAMVKPKVIQIHPNYYKNSNKFSQTNALFCQLPQNMTTDCSFSTCYFTTNCSERRQKFKTILCKVWGTYINVNLPYNHYVIFWVNWRVQVHLKEFNQKYSRLLDFWV